MLLQITCTMLKTHSSPEDSSRGSEVERATSRVGVHSLLDELCVLDLVSRYCRNKSHTKTKSNQCTHTHTTLTCGMVCSSLKLT